MRRSRSGLAAAAALAACVSYDAAGPFAPEINGSYATVVAMTLSNQVELRHDTAAATLVLRDSMYRGRFHGYYRFTGGDSGRVAGTLRPGNLVILSHFGPWPPLAYVDYLRRLYPACDFPRVNPMHIAGDLRGDTLLLGGSGSVPCFYSGPQNTVELGTELELRLIGVRP